MMVGVENIAMVAQAESEIVAVGKLWTMEEAIEDEDWTPA